MAKYTLKIHEYLDGQVRLAVRYFNDGPTIYLTGPELDELIGELLEYRQQMLEKSANEAELALLENWGKARIPAVSRTQGEVLPIAKVRQWRDMVDERSK